MSNGMCGKKVSQQLYSREWELCQPTLLQQTDVGPLPSQRKGGRASISKPN